LGGNFGEKLPEDVNKTAVPTPEVTTTETATTTSTEETAAVSTPVTPTASKIETVKCELCHKDPQDLDPHLNGGKLCINCHGSQVHTIHIGTGTVNLDCSTCHGSPPKIPVVEKGEGPGHYSVCEKCHAPPPNSTQPSLGNLVVIHLSRGKYCTNCHGTDIGTIHEAKLANATKK
ncbi:MAG: hypothetical protein J5U19_06160, partial [Candidatus Methanoperedens sp.]|nr:hypothetical protein [Candidatus Methanoperedens sp.]